MQRRDWLKWTAGVGAAGLPLLASAAPTLVKLRLESVAPATGRPPFCH